MTPAHWARMKEVYLSAREKPENEREAFLSEVLPDGSLQQEVRRLLAAEGGAGLESPVAGILTSDTSRGVSPAPPAVIGRYRILRLLSEGGMGVVYEAQQDQPRRTVALKVIKPGFISSDLLRRFEHESQVLGRLHHPGIAQIFEAGSADSGFGPQPYFAMEFVQGASLLLYADAHQLNTRQRLELVARICEAVHHAHQRGVIHRDLKPDNILVDETGQPKVLDFGIARATDADAHATRQTVLGQVVGTLAYMSPEQAMGDLLELDTRSDVYALGVILFELLAGRLPYDICGQLARAVQTICEEDPARLGSVQRTFRGDIETIVSKALEKDKTRRYASAAEFGADIVRYLHDEPIVARPSTTIYQLRKFARRHRSLVLGMAVAFAMLIVAIAASTREAARARRAELRAERRFSDVRSLARSFLFQFHDAIARLPGATPARQLVVSTALQYLESLAQESHGDHSLEWELAEAFEKVGEIQGGPGAFNLGDTPGALASYGKAAALREELVGAEPAKTEHHRRLADNYRNTGRILVALGQYEKAVEMHRKAVGLLERLEGPDPKSLQVLKFLAAAYMDLGPALGLRAGTGRDQGAVDACARAVLIYEKVSAFEPSLPNRRNLALAFKNLAAQQPGDTPPEIAVRLATLLKAVAIDEAVVHESHGDAGYQMDLAVSYGETGLALWDLERYREAVGFCTRSLQIRQALAASDPKNARIRTAVGFAHSKLAWLLAEAGGDPGDAMRHARAALAIYQAEVRSDPENARNGTFLAISERIMGDVYAYSGRCDQALRHYQEAISRFDELERSGRLSALSKKNEAVLAERNAERCKGR